MVRIMMLSLMMLLGLVSSRVQADEFLYTGVLTDTSGKALNLTTTLNTVSISLWSAQSSGTQTLTTLSFTSVPVEQGVFQLHVNTGSSGTNLLSFPWIQLVINGSSMTPRTSSPWLPRAHTALWSSKSDTALMANHATTADTANQASNASQLNGLSSTSFVVKGNDFISEFTTNLNTVNFQTKAREAVLSSGMNIMSTSALMLSTTNAAVTTRIVVQNSSGTSTFVVDSSGTARLTTVIASQDATLKQAHIQGMLTVDTELIAGMTGSRPMAYKQSGPLGLGTITPVATMDVRGHHASHPSMQVLTNGGGQPALYVHSSGMVGVMTMVPSANFQVNGHSTASPTLAVWTPGKTSPALFVDGMGKTGIMTTNTIADLTVKGSASSVWPLAVMTSGSATVSLAVSSTGMVGIMTAVPMSTLHVNGTIRANSFIDANGMTIGVVSSGLGTGAGVSAGVMNYASGSYAFVGGGEGNKADGMHASIGGGKWNTDAAPGRFNTISGGHMNWTSGHHSSVGGGAMNMAWSTGTIAGGEKNQAWMYGSVAGGGWNTAADWGFVGAGSSNVASGMYNSIVGGGWNQVWGQYSSIGGGRLNTNAAHGEYNSISGGHMNWTSGWHSSVGGGAMNMAWSTGTISGGEKNEASMYGSVAGGGWNTASNYGAVGGGWNNWAGGQHSAIPGGHNLKITGDRSFGFNGSSTSTLMTISQTSVAAFLGVSVGIGTTNPMAALDVNGGIRVGNAMNPVTGTIAWVADQFVGWNGIGWVNLQTQQSSGGGWTTGASTISLSETTQMVAIGAPGANAKLTVQGSISRDLSNAMLGIETMTFVNLGMMSQAGHGAVTATHVTISGGVHHTASATGASVGGGAWNTATAEYAVIGGGHANRVMGGYSSVSGGGWNTAEMHSMYNTISGGQMNWTSGMHSSVGGGMNNMANTTGSVAGGVSNTATNYGAVGGGWNNWAGGQFSAIPGGHNLMITGDRSFGFNGSTTTALMMISRSSVASFLGVSMGVGTTNPSAIFTVKADNSSVWPFAVETAAISAIPSLAVSSTGWIGIQTAVPRATLDIHGFAKLRMHSAEPVACVTDTLGSLAMTSVGALCSCTSGASWARTTDVFQPCNW
ncbi:MAG: hypothetical protein H3C47_03445 [Candidatus Cloacimonetes bacterium]|nr:hypothetical protein [Candidatus Cloacimonadota bacterium]